MKDRGTRLVVDWGHLALLMFISAVVIAYLFDARATSLRINNLLLVEPGAIIALILVAAVLPQCFRRVNREMGEAEEPEKTESLSDLGKVAALAGGFGAFVLSLETVGFVVATFLFTAIGVYICGERKLWVIALFSAAVTLAIIYGYQTLVPFPFPLSVL
jgi:hypothetical protein